LPVLSQTQASEPQGSELGAQESALRKSARQTPNDPRVLARLGTVLAMQGKLEESVGWLEKALKLDPGNADTRRTLATSYWQLGQLEKSRTNLERVLRAKPQDGWSSLLLGMVSEDLGDHPRAVRLLSGVLRRVQQRSEPILALARAYYQLKDKDKARETLRYLSDLPNDSKGVFAGGRAAAEFRDYETAETLFRSIQYTYPDPAELQFNLALAQYGERRYDDSQKTLLALVQSGQANANAYELLGWTYQQQDHLDEMMKAFETAINMEPGQESHFLELGQALLEKRNSETALEVAKEAVRRFPTSSRAASLKGSAELHMSRLTEALESYKKAVELDPKDPKAMLGLALTYWNANQDAEAAKVFAEGARKFPSDALLQLKYAIFLINAPEEKTLEREAQIEKLLKRSEELDDSMAETHFHLGNVAVRQSKYEEALREFVAAADLDPEMSKTHFALARVYRRLGREQDAARETEIHAKLKAKEEQNSEANAGIGTRHP
jgi:superkiller protein 3